MARKMDYEEARKYTIETIRNFLDGTGGKSETDPPVKKSGAYCSEDGFRELRSLLEGLERNRR
jgi:hypothetical protein